MAVTALGKRYARNIKAGNITLLDVPLKRLQDTKDSFMELFGYPVDELEV